MVRRSTNREQAEVKPLWCEEDRNGEEGRNTLRITTARVRLDHERALFALPNTRPTSNSDTLFHTTNHCVSQRHGKPTPPQTSPRPVAPQHYSTPFPSPPDAHKNNANAARTCGVRVDLARRTLQPWKQRRSIAASLLRSMSRLRRLSLTASRQTSITRRHARRRRSTRNLSAGDARSRSNRRQEPRALFALCGKRSVIRVRAGTCHTRFTQVYSCHSDVDDEPTATAPTVMLRDTYGLIICEKLC